MALTYISLFALVPALVVAFSVVQARSPGCTRIVRRACHEFLVANLAVGARGRSIEPYLDRFVYEHARDAAPAWSAVRFLLWSAVIAPRPTWSGPSTTCGRCRGAARSRLQRWLIYWVALTLRSGGAGGLGRRHPARTRTLLASAGRDSSGGAPAPAASSPRRSSPRCTWWSRPSRVRFRRGAGRRRGRRASAWELGQVASTRCSCAQFVPLLGDRTARSRPSSSSCF